MTTPMSSHYEKTVLITGCSAGGIGHALAREFHAQGLRVFASSRTMASMQELQDMGITTLELDVTDVEAVRRVRDVIAIKTGGRLDILVNNAGQGYPVAATDMDMSCVRNVFEVNIFAPMVMVQEFIHLLMASGDGRILHIGSISGIMPVPFSAAYNASKAAVHAYNNTLRVELAPLNVRVINILSGGVKSNISRPYSIPESSLYHPMDDIYQKTRASASQVNAMPADEYARRVVPEALRRKPRAWFWVGQNSFLVWFMDTFLGRTGFDLLMTKRFGLDIFARRILRQ